MQTKVGSYLKQKNVLLLPLIKLLQPLYADECGYMDKNLIHMLYSIADVNLSSWYIAAAAAAAAVLAVQAAAADQCRRR
jgi:hypothetical protein